MASQTPGTLPTADTAAQKDGLGLDESQLQEDVFTNAVLHPRSLMTFRLDSLDVH